MKRVILTFLVILAGFLYFSFFINENEVKKADYTNLYIDRELQNPDAFRFYLKFRSREKGVKIRILEFEKRDVDSILIIDRDAVFISDQKLKSDLYDMESLNLSFVCIATVSPYSSEIELNADEFNEYLGYGQEVKIRNHDVQIGFIESLSLNKRFLKVEGYYPTIENILDGRYKGVFKAKVNFVSPRKKTLNSLIADELKYLEERSFTIIAGGDIMLSRGVEVYIRKYGKDYPFRKLGEYLANRDIAFANLECPLTRSKERFSPFKGIYFKADPENAYSLVDVGIDVLSLANNHILDWGITGVFDTIKYLDKVGIKWTGVGRSLEEALKPADFTIKGTRVGFVACNNIYPTHIRDEDETVVIPTLDDLLESEVPRKLALNYNLLVVSVHSGVEYVNKPDILFMGKLRRLIDEGVDIVFGSHPHVIQGIEIYKERIIAYSLGNLVFDQNWSEDTSTGLLIEIGLINNRPVYFYPLIVYIDKAQPRIVRSGAYDILIPQKSRGGIYYAKK